MDVRTSHDVESIAVPDRPEGESTASAQAMRRDVLMARHRLVCRNWYVGRDPVRAHWRYPLWHALSLLGGDEADAALGVEMLEAAAAGEGKGHFWSSTVASILVRHGQTLDDGLRKRLETRLAGYLPDEARQRFRGYNDNFPAMAAMAALVGGDWLGDDDAITGGLENLRSLRRLLTRRGNLTEYASPTYSAITLTCLAEIVAWCPLEAARELALAAEQRVWVEVCSRWHRGTSSLAGPHSRAYIVDMCAHPHNITVPMYVAFGDEVVWGVELPLTEDVAERAVHNKFEAGLAHTAWHAAPAYHPPAEAEALVRDVPARRVVRADSEQAAFHRNVWSADRHPVTPLAEFPASESDMYTFMTPRFALGTSDRPSMNSYQHTAMHLTYRRAETLQRLGDIAALFPRYLTNDKQPDRCKHLNDEGRTLCVQHASTAMVLYCAKPGWNANSTVEDATIQPVSSLKLSLLLTCFGARPRELWLGETELDAWSGRGEAPAPVFFRDGRVYTAIHPLHLTDHDRDAAVVVHEANGFGIIDFVNYRGAERTFTASELMTTRNGFVIEVAEAPDFTSFAEFRAAHASPAIVDEYHAPDAMRLVRYDRDGLSLGMEVSPISEGVKCRTVNDQLVRPVKLEIEGLDTGALPWM